MKKTLLKNVKKGDYFTLQGVEYPTAKQVFVRQEYDRYLKRYVCLKYDDILSNGRYFKGNLEVYIDFIF